MPHQSKVSRAVQARMHDRLASLSRNGSKSVPNYSLNEFMNKRDLTRRHASAKPISRVRGKRSRISFPRGSRCLFVPHSAAMGYDVKVDSWPTLSIRTTYSAGFRLTDLKTGCPAKCLGYHFSSNDRVTIPIERAAPSKPSSSICDIEIVTSRGSLHCGSF